MAVHATVPNPNPMPWSPSITASPAAAADPWTGALQELRAEFLRESRLKLAAVTELVERLGRNPGDTEALADLHRRFHGFAGAGTSYGFPEMSRLGAAGERTCLALLESGRPPGLAEIETWRELDGRLRSDLEEVSAGPRPEGSTLVKTPAPLEALLVDDDAEMCRIAAHVLEAEGMIAKAVGSRAAALAVVAEGMPDVVLVDVGLPDGSGYDLVEDLRRRPDGEGCAVLIISVRDDFQGRVQGVTCGADGYFEKPVDWEALLRRLHHVLERTRQEPGRVLSVEDDPAEAAFLRTVLESGGYEFEVCASPERFEAALTAFKPDLVLMDVNLPGFTGYDLVRYVRQHERYATLPILFLTTESAMGAHMETARAGGDDHLVKPVAPGLLLSTVAARVERARFVKSLLERDGLTRLLTHTSCQERAKALVAQRKRSPQRPVAWVMLDLDHFKSINDRYGHPTGDKVLLSLAGLLRRRLRQSDTVARYGGEEFVILFEDLGEPEVLRLVSRLLGEFSSLDHAAPDGTRFRATISAGVAMLDPGSMGVERWKQAADDALYLAKSAGRNRVMGAGALYDEPCRARPSCRR
jgi:diguanylate cyclase (GGDEF)-like protein